MDLVWGIYPILLIYSIGNKYAKDKDLFSLD